MESDQQLTYVVQKAKIKAADIDRIELRDETQRAFLNDLMNFTPAQDSQIVDQLSKLAS